MAHLRLPHELFGRVVTNNDLTIAKLKRFYADEKHESTTCDGCKEEGFTGLRFKCDTCPDYDLCYKCASTGVSTKDHKSTHPLMLCSRREIMQIPVNDIELGEKLGNGAFGKNNVSQLSNKKLLVVFKDPFIRVVGFRRTYQSLVKSL